MVAAGHRTSVASIGAARCYAIPLALFVAAACRLREWVQLLSVLFARTDTVVQSAASGLWRTTTARLCQLRHVRPAKALRALTGDAPQRYGTSQSYTCGIA
jgi:hypothetical protein